MKEKVRLLSKGIFEYENPEIAISEEQIRLEVESGKIYEGRFIIDSLNNLEIRTKVFSSHKLMKLSCNDYIKSRVVVEYVFDATELVADEVVDGHFSIISNGGEFEVPYHVTVCQPYCQSSIGEIKDLEQFTELAQENWHEAVKIFKSENFKRVFLQKKNYAHIYELLVQSRNINQAMEEFLCTIKFKKKVGIRISQDSICVENLTESVREHLVLEKDNWGYKRLKVTAVGDFIQIYKKELSTEDFLGSYYELEYVVNPELFKYGHNYGKIVVETVDERIEIPVTSTRLTNRFKEEYRKSLNESVLGLYTLFANYQMGSMSKLQWMRETREAVDSCRNRSKEDVYALYEAHYNLLCEQEDAAKEILDAINGRELRHQSVVLYCYYIYLTALLRKDPNYDHFAKDKIDSYFESNYQSWQLLWMKISLSPKMSGFKKFHMIKSVFGLGARSPLMYIEALNCVEEDPSLLREFGEFEVQLITWASRNQRLTSAIIDQFSDICVGSRFFSELALRTMIEISDKRCSKSVVAGICALLIRGAKTEYKYNLWYRRGIEASLRQQGLYENYMNSLDLNESHRLPTSVLIYFNYDNHLTTEQRAFLYAYVIENKQQNPRMYADYENIMKAFAYEQLAQGAISNHLVTLYQHFVEPETMTTKAAGLMPNVIFKQEVTVDNPWMAEVIVSHRDVDMQKTYKITGGKAFVDIYMDEYYLIFVDSYGWRYSGTVAYQIKPLLETSDFVRVCASMNTDNAMILLNRSERAIRYQKSDDVSIEIYKKTLQLYDVGEQYKKTILNNLIDYYYDNYEGETLEKYLLQLDISIMDAKERGKIIEYYIQRGLFDMAYNAIQIYGYEYIQDKKVMRLCSRKIKESGYEKQDLLVEMAYYAFTCGKYDDTLLQYLIRYYMGTTKDLYAIWVAAKNFEVDTFELDEDILCQTLFAESSLSDIFRIFDSYYKRRPDQKLVKAFLAYHSYKYLVLEESVQHQLFKYLEIEYEHMNVASDVCCLALLKYYSESEHLIRMHESFIVAQVEKYIETDMVLPFFSAFASIEALPAELLLKAYVSCHVHPDHEVTVCYTYDQELPMEDYQEAAMTPVIGDLYVKAFTVFADEKLTYYLKDKIDQEYSIIEGETIDGSSLDTDRCAGMAKLNQMLAYKASGNMEALTEAVRSYETKKHISEQLFGLL